MELRVRLSNLKKMAMKEIEDAAKTGDVDRIGRLSMLANRVQDEERSYALMEKRVDGYEAQLNNSAAKSFQAETMPLAGPGRNTTQIAEDVRIGRIGELLEDGDDGYSKGKRARMDGKNARREFIDAGRARGYSLMRYKGQIYKTADGRKVPILFSNEIKPDRWFLGVKDDKYDTIVFLCKADNGGMHEFILPYGVLANLWHLLSINAGDRKFNITRDAGDFFLQVPMSEHLSINEFYGNYGPLVS